MMSNIKKFLPIALLLYAISACNETMVRVQDGNNDNQIRAEVNKNFSIQLESQLSTGFSWKLMKYPEHISIVQENVKTEESDKTGGIDIQEFILKSSSKGEFDILFQYGEHWKKNPEYEKSSKIKVVIE